MAAVGLGRAVTDCRCFVEEDRNVVALEHASVGHAQDVADARLARGQEGVDIRDESLGLEKEELALFRGLRAVCADEHLRRRGDAEHRAERLIDDLDVSGFVFEQHGLVERSNEDGESPCRGIGRRLMGGLAHLPRLLPGQ